MPEFFNVFTPDVALQTLLDRLQRRVATETVPTHRALGRVTAEAVFAPEHLPAFPRSTMDGYAVRARDTFGASESLPAYLEVVGEVRMGQPPDVTLATGQAAVAYTGGMLAHSADAVVMVQNTQKIDATSIEVLRPVAPGENVIQV
jgi:molybdopterin molybdotransferase